MKKIGRPRKSDQLLDPKKVAVNVCDVFGATDTQICKVLEISEPTFNDWKSREPEFFKSLKAAKDGADAQVELSLLKKATGCTTIEIKEVSYGGGVSETTTTTKQHAPDTTAMIFWLKNRQPEKYRDKQTIEHEGTLELPTPIFTTTPPKKK